MELSNDNETINIMDESIDNQFYETINPLHIDINRKYTCNICHEESSHQDIMRPCCYCKGNDSQISHDTFVHKTCFYKWMQYSDDNVCYLCRTPYVIDYYDMANQENYDDDYEDAYDTIDIHEDMVFEEITNYLCFLKLFNLIIAFICWYLLFGLFGYCLFIMFQSTVFDMSYLSTLKGFGLHFGYAIFFTFLCLLGYGLNYTHNHISRNY